MNKVYAREAALQVAQRHAGQTYQDLTALDAAEHEYHRLELCGTTYQVTFEVFWDDRSGGLLRVWVAVDDCGPCAFMPLVFCALVAPSETFQGALQ